MREGQGYMKGEKGGGAEEESKREKSEGNKRKRGLTDTARQAERQHPRWDVARDTAAVHSTKLI